MGNHQAIDIVPVPVLVPTSVHCVILWVPERIRFPGMDQHRNAQFTTLGLNGIEASIINGNVVSIVVFIGQA